MGEKNAIAVTQSASGADRDILELSVGIMSFDVNAVFLNSAAQQTCGFTYSFFAQLLYFPNDKPPRSIGHPII